jgi:hypothetical protein
MNALNLARHNAAATGNGRLGKFLPNSAGALWLSYLIRFRCIKGNQSEETHQFGVRIDRGQQLHHDTEQFSSRG